MLSYSVGLAQTTMISGVVNSYERVSMISGDTITMETTRNLTVSDEVLIIQMQGAIIDETNTSSFGDITAMKNAGNYEFTSVCNILNDSQIIVTAISRSYSIDGNVQLVQVPSYTDAVVTAPLQAKPWDGKTGGVLALKCSGKLALQDDINLQGIGFRGGQTTTSSYPCVWFFFVDEYYYDINSGEGAMKGEGIAKYITGKTGGRGPQANGGGGGNDHNSGGGGGANATAGGFGGQRIRSSAFKCGATAPGIGGKQNNYSTIDNRVFMGGGGGAGHEDNANAATSGGNGGGIVFLVADSLVSNNNTINVSGDIVSDTSLDGAGGGGAAGTALLQVNSFIGQLNITAKGGDGGYVENLSTVNCNGPGGGGAGGVVWFSKALQPTSVNVSNQGGSSGVILSSAQSNCTIGASNNATNGSNGIVLTGLKLVESTCDKPNTIKEVSICSGDRIMIKGEWIDTSGVFYDTITVSCCDSVIETRLTVLEEKESKFDATICKGDTITLNGTEYTFPVQGAIEVFTNVGPYNCDSTVVFNLTVIDLDTSIRVSDSLLTSNNDDAEYQWIDCETSEPIKGATNQSFVAQNNGRYAVTISQAGCESTSECYAVSSYDTLVTNPNRPTIKVYPNPTSGALTIDMGMQYENVQLTLVDEIGQFVVKKEYQNIQEINLNLSISSGAYVLLIEYDGLRSNIPFVKY